MTAVTDRQRHLPGRPRSKPARHPSGTAGPAAGRQSGGARPRAVGTHRVRGELSWGRCGRPGPPGPGRGRRAAPLRSPLLFAPRARRSGERVAAAGRCGPGREGGSPAEAQEGSGGRRRRRCSVLAAGSFRPHQGRAAPGGPREAGRGERGRSPWRLVAILVLLLRGAECPLPARLPPPSAPPPPPPGWLPRPGPARPPEESGWGMAGGGSGPSGSAGTARSPLVRLWWFIKNN